MTSKAKDCKGILIAYSFRNDTTDTEKYRKLIPKGFYIFTELAAKDALESKIKVGAFGQKLEIAESELEKCSGELLIRTIERNVYKTQNEEKDKELRKKNRKLIFSKFLNYVQGAGVIALFLIKTLPP
jgi:hypothetical protein